MASRTNSTGRRFVIRDEPLGCRAWWIAPDGTETRGPSGHKRPALRRKLTLEGAVEIVTEGGALVATSRPVEKGGRL